MQKEICTKKKLPDMFMEAFQDAQSESLTRWYAGASTEEVMKTGN